MNKKSGHVEIIFLMLFITIIIVLVFSIYILYTQIVTNITPIKQDLFYIVQNSYLSLNKNDLEYNEYSIDNSTLEERVGKVLENNHSNCKLESISYDINSNIVHVRIVINIEPIILNNYIGNLQLFIEDDIKLKMMEVSK